MCNINPFLHTSHIARGRLVEAFPTSGTKRDSAPASAGAL